MVKGVVRCGLDLDLASFLMAVDNISSQDQGGTTDAMGSLS
jgi:hypothetical protein